ncbi:MAG TPA: pyruvate kinase [Isosphaeraceae bacterium]|nr:pyruvate kinase [Isosphaeraceae bacterium]
MRPVHKEQFGKVRTKIVATVGPASSDPKVLRAMVEAGVDVFRLNFSHGTHAEHTAQYAAIRRIGEELDVRLAILQDLCGPKIRLGEIPGGVVSCDYGAEFLLTSKPDPAGDPRHLSSTHAELPAELAVGQTVLFADGTVAMDVIAQATDQVRLRVTLPGLIRSHQGINIPGGNLSVASLTEKDRTDLDWTAAHPVEYLGLSFVREAEDIAALRRELKSRRIGARIVAKIEKRQALLNLDAIIGEADAVMVARGDLGVELDVTRVPAVQKRIIAACREARVPVITATQMLNSMESSSRPTRAEATDVFNAVLDGTDAVMLSGETAIGQYPVESVATMSRIAAEAESYEFAANRGESPAPWHGDERPRPGPGPGEPRVVARAGQVRPTTESVVAAASLISRRLNAALLAVVTHSGRTALALSKQRNPAPTLALAGDPETARAMALYWGVTPYPLPELADHQQRRAIIQEWCQARGLVAPGDRVVILRGTSPDDPTHNEIEVREIS